MIRYAIAKREPLRVEQENFRDAVLGTGDHIVTMAEGVHTLTGSRGHPRVRSHGETVRLEAAARV
ncbi:hypothetical protein GCM10009790_09270 [Georgenia ruanii]